MENHQNTNRQYLTPEFYSKMKIDYLTSLTLFKSELDLSENTSKEKELAFLSNNLDEYSDLFKSRSLWLQSFSNDTYELFSLNFTFGQSFETMREDLTLVIEAFELYQKALGIYEKSPQISPLGFAMLDEFEQALQLISLCYLLHRRDLLPRLRKLFDPGYAGQDTVYEDLMSFDIAGRIDLDEWFHKESYSTLVNAMYLGEPAANSELLKYCQKWYDCFEFVAPWYNNHLYINDSGYFFGYWAFEAGAIAMLYDLDDSKIDNLVYPKELVAWSRANIEKYGKNY